MKRTLSIFSILLAFVMTVAALGQTTYAQQTKPEHFSKRQLNTLIAAARTPAEHQRIAQYYQAKAQLYLAQAKEHEQMLAAYNANPSIGGKSRAAFVDHCKSYSQYSKDMAVKSQGLAQLHEQIARDVEQK
jgi:hypothetical protein